VEEERPTPWNPVAVGDVNFLPFFVPQEPQRCAARLVDCAGGMEPREAEIFFEEAQGPSGAVRTLGGMAGEHGCARRSLGEAEAAGASGTWHALCRACSGGLVGGTRNLDGGGTWSPGLAREVYLRPFWSGLRTWERGARRAEARKFGGRTRLAGSIKDRCSG